MPDITDIEQYFKDNNIDINNLSNIAYQIQRNNDLLKGGLRSSNVKSFRTIDTFNSQDSLDATYPMYLHLNIGDEMIKIVSIKLSFWILPFRAYDKSAASGGGATSGATGTLSGGGSTTPSGGGSTTPSGGGHTSSTDIGTPWTVPACGSINIIAHEGGYYFNNIPSFAIVSRNSHTHSVYNHQHATPNHQHATPDHTHPEHTHTTPNHTHDITFGIYEESNSPTIGFQISRDNGKTYGAILGTYTADVANLEIKDYIEAAGSYIIQFTSNVRARLSVQITIKLDISAR